MAEASSSRRPRDDSSPSDDERKISEASSRRRPHYAGQRVGHSTRPSTAGSRTSRGKRASYQQPEDYGSLDEDAIPPLTKPDDWKTQHPPSLREDRTRNSRSTSKSKVRRRVSGHHGEDELAGAASPPPVPTSRDREVGPGAQQFHEDFDHRGHFSDEHTTSYQSRRPEEPARDKDETPKTSRFLTELCTISYLIFFAILGTLARLGVQWIVFYPGTPIVTPVIWPNFGASLILGFLMEDENMFRDPSQSSRDVFLGERLRDLKPGPDLKELNKAEAAKRKKAIPLYIGLATGLCGSFTSFSSFARDAFLALSNDLPTPIDHRYTNAVPPPVSSTVSRNGGYSFEAFLHVVVATIALSLGGYIAGAQIAVFAHPIIPRIHRRVVQKFVDPAVVFLGFGCWLGAVFLAIWPPANAWRGEVVFALVFAPIGCLLRFYASLKLNSLVPSFPLGTFAVNMLGTAIEGMCYDIQHVRVGVMGRVGGGMVGCQILQGVQDGFCGCLTTISTWVAEINGLKRKHGWAYAFGSVFGGLCLMVIVMGSVRWSVGFSTPVCDTGYTSKVHG